MNYPIQHRIPVEGHPCWPFRWEHERIAAQAGEAGTAATPQSGVVHEHAVGNADAPKGAA